MAEGKLSINRHCEKCGTDFWCEHFSMDGEQCGCHSCSEALTVPAPFYRPPDSGFGGPNILEVFATALAFAFVDAVFGKPSRGPAMTREELDRWTRDTRKGKKKKKKEQAERRRRLSKKTRLSSRP